jgi:hypothetical protein
MIHTSAVALLKVYQTLIWLHRFGGINPVFDICTSPSPLVAYCDALMNHTFRLLVQLGSLRILPIPSDRYMSTLFTPFVTHIELTNS